MSESINVDVPFKPPESIFSLCNDVLQHGVIHLLVPPQELLSQWMQEDGVYANDQKKKEEFLKNWKFDLQLLNEDDSVREECCESLEEKAQEVMPFLQMFILSVQERIVVTVLEQLMPLFVMDEDEDTVLSTSSESIADSIAKLQPLNKSADLVPQISEVITELLQSIQVDLESEDAKKILHMIKEIDDDEEFDKVKSDLEQKHGYKRIAVKTAHDQLLPIFMSQLDSIMVEVCQYLRERIYNRVEEMLLEDRENLPGPQHME